jgi:hypothetical protein
VALPWADAAIVTPSPTSVPRSAAVEFKVRVSPGGAGIIVAGWQSPTLKSNTQVGMSHSGAPCPDERGPYRLNPAAAAAHQVDRGPPPGALRRRIMVNKQFMKLGPRPVGKFATVITEDTYYRILRRRGRTRR